MSGQLSSVCTLMTLKIGLLSGKGPRATRLIGKLIRLGSFPGSCRVFLKVLGSVDLHSAQHLGHPHGIAKGWALCLLFQMYLGQHPSFPIPFIRIFPHTFVIYLDILLPHSLRHPGSSRIPTWLLSFIYIKVHSVSHKVLWVLTNISWASCSHPYSST